MAEKQLNPAEGTTGAAINERGEPRRFRAILSNAAAANDDIRQAIKAYRERGWEIDVRVAWENGQAEMFARNAADQRLGGILAVGGDGTLSEVANGVLAANRGAECPIGIIPAGTANDFAQMAGVPTGDPLAALNLIANTTPVAMDVGAMGDRYFVNMATAGFPARMTTSTPAEAKRLLGGLAYLLTGLANVENVEARHARITSPDFQWEGDLIALCIGNGRQAGGGFQVNPNAILDDGALDVTIIPSHDGHTSVLQYIHELLHLREQHNHSELLHFRTAEATVHAPDGLQVNLDGEPHSGTDFHFRAVPAALRVHLPPTAPLRASEQNPLVRG